MWKATVDKDPEFQKAIWKQDAFSRKFHCRRTITGRKISSTHRFEETGHKYAEATAVCPATVGIKTTNPSIRCKEWIVDIVTANQSWPVSRAPRASVNSFGFGGSNYHAIVEAWEAEVLTNGCGDSPVEEDPERLYLLPLSARSETSLR